MEPGERNKENGLTESFTLLFQHLYSFTFAMSESQAILRKKEEERKKKQALLDQQAASGKDDKNAGNADDEEVAE